MMYYRGDSRESSEADKPAEPYQTIGECAEQPYEDIIQMQESPAPQQSGRDDHDYIYIN